MLFAAPAFRTIAGELVAGEPSLAVGAYALERHPNGELHVDLLSAVDGVDCVALGTVRPPEGELVGFSLLCDTLRRNGARSVAAVLPYLAYARQDRFEPRTSFAAAWLGQLLAASGVARVLTLDVHSARAFALVPGLVSAGSEALLVAALGERVGPGVTLVAPDEGALGRCERVRRATGLELPAAHCKKERSRTGVRARLVGTVTPEAVVIDDILDTGGTLIACVEAIVAAGARRIAVAVSHGLFTGDAWRRLWDLGVDAIVCTDSVGDPAVPDARVRVVPCAPALLPTLRAWMEVNHATA